MNDTEQYLFYTGDYLELIDSQKLQQLSKRELQDLARNIRKQIENMQEQSFDTRQVIRNISHQIFGSDANIQHNNEENSLYILETNLNNILLELSNRRKKS